MQCGQHAIHFIVNCSPLGIVHFWHCRVPENPTLEMLHDIKHRADDVVIHAKRYRVGNRYIGVSKCIQHPVFAVHGMGRGQQFARWLASQHILMLACRELEGGVRLSARKFLSAQRLVEARDIGTEPGFQPGEFKFLCAHDRPL